MLSGSEQEQLVAMRDYLFRLAKSLEDASASDTAVAVTASVRPDGTRVYDKNATLGKTIEEVRKEANELRSLIIKSSDNVIAYTDRKIEQYNAVYGAESVFGSLLEEYSRQIEETAMGALETYGYKQIIDGLQDDFYTKIDGVIQRGIVWDPDTSQYVLGIAVSQNLQFEGECGSDDPNNPGDGKTYYYLSTGQTFGLYTSTGWQFWIDGTKVGWFSSLDSMLHVRQVVVEQSLQISDSWKFVPGTNELEIKYIGS